MLKIKCFGDFQVEFDNRIISDFETEKTRALLAYLAVESDRPHRRSHLAGLLWSDEPEERALHNLRQTLSRLRKSMGKDFSSGEYILSDRESLQLNPSANIWVDTVAFSNDLKQAYRFCQSPKGQGLINYRYLKRATSFYQGEFLSQFCSGKSTLFEEWVLLIREKYNLQAIKVFAELTRYYERRAEYHHALETGCRMVELAPWDETARAQVISLYGLTQQWSAANSQYIALRNYLLEQFNVEPSADLVTLHRQIQQAAAEKIAFQPKLQPYPRFLPEGLTTFVGREKDLDQLMDLVINPEIRLISLVGPGGIGKTSLAINLAHQLTGVFSGSVYFAACLLVQTPDQFIKLMGDVTGLVFNDQNDPKRQLIDHLRQNENLLVLDNFEHLVSNLENIHIVNELLTQTNTLKVIVTSREKLNLQQEYCYNLKGLNCPSAETVSLEEANDFDALSLFVNRMRQLNNDFKLTEKNLASIVHICRVLEGLPLGIELASAAAWEQGYEIIAQRIQSDMDSISARFHNTLPRHRNLRVVFDVSWVSLSPEEQDILAKLSLFRGGFNLQAAQNIVQATPIVLSALVSKSLVRISNESRFDLHEVIRQFAMEKQMQSGKMAEIQTRHAMYYADFLAEKNKSLLSLQQATILTEIQLEFGNIQLMWNELVYQHLFSELLKCANSVYQFFSIRGLLREGIEWFDFAIKQLPSGVKTELIKGILLSYLGALANQARQRNLALESLSTSQRLLLLHHNQVDLAFCRLHLGWFFWRENDFSTAENYAQQSMADYETLQENLGIAENLFLLGNIRQKQSKNTDAKDYFDKALLICRKTGHQRLLVLILNRLSDLACYEGYYQIAVQQFSECLQISQKLNDQYTQAVLLNNLGTIYHVWKDYPIAQNYYQQSLNLCREIGDLEGTALALNNLGEISTALGNFANAFKYIQEALKMTERNDEQWTKIVCLNSMGELYLKMEQYEKSEKTLLFALQVAVDIQGIELVIRITINLGRVYQLKGNYSDAGLLLQSAAAHSSTELELREQALGWLKEINNGFDISQRNDRLLMDAVNKILFSENHPQVSNIT